MIVREMTIVSNLDRFPELKIMYDRILERGWFACAKGNMYLYKNGELRLTAEENPAAPLDAFWDTKEALIKSIQRFENQA